MKKIKKLWWKHWNILPWLVCGGMVLIEGEISRTQYGLVWVCNLAMIWRYMPVKYFGGKDEEESIH